MTKQRGVLYGNDIPKADRVSMSRLVNWVNALLRLPAGWILTLTLAVTVLVGVIDYATGYDMNVSAFYLIAICLASWAVGLRAGLFIGAVSAAVCGAASLMTGHAYEHPLIPYWNTLVMLVLFTATAYWTAGLKAEISARARVERLLERQEKLAVLGTLTAGLAHEIRNPLTSLKARLYTLEKHVQGVPAAQRDTQIISSEISRLEHVVRDALSFARPADPRLEPIAADALLREVQGLMSAALESRGVHLVVESGPGLSVRVDRGHMIQVLINLVNNAADAIEGAGTVTLRARALPGGREKSRINLEVCDTGKGIPPEVEKRLFDPFFSTKETGTGLGLPIAARIVEKHGGTLQYQTSPGRGTTFSIILPGELNDAANDVKHNAESKT